MARRDGDYQHAAPRRAEPAWRHAGDHLDGADRRQGGAAARDRSGRDPEDQRAGRQSQVRPGQRAGQPSVFHQLLRERGPRQGSADLQVGRTQSPKRAAAGFEGARQRCGDQLRINAGSVGFDGLFVIKPDGRMYIQTGIGNLGTESFSDCQRVAAEMMGMPWEKCVVTWGDTSRNLPWSCVSGGSQTTHAMTRAAHAAASDGIKKLQQIAAKDLGGRPGRLRRGRRARLAQRGRGGHDARARGPAGDRARRRVTTVTRCPKTSTPLPSDPPRRLPGRA